MVLELKASGDKTSPTLLQGDKKPQIQFGWGEYTFLINKLLSGVQFYMASRNLFNE